MTQIWTETIRTFLSEQVDCSQDMNSSTSFNDFDVRYVINLIAWCDEERLIDLAMIEDWFLSKCCEAISYNSSSATSGITSPYGSSAHSYSSIRNRRNMRVNFDGIFGLSMDMKNLYYNALDKCAELLSRRSCPPQLKVSLYYFIRLLRKQVNASKFFTSIFQLVDQPIDIKKLDPNYNIKLYTIKVGLKA